MKEIKEIQWSLDKLTKCVVIDVPVLKTYSHNEMIEDLNNLQDLINDYTELKRKYDKLLEYNEEMKKLICRGECQ